MARLFHFTIFVSLTLGLLLGGGRVSQASVSMLSSQDLKTYCLSTYDIDLGYCAGYVTAVADLMVEHRIYGYEACHMEQMAPQKMVAHVRGYIRKNPGVIKGNARLMIARILSELFPCL